MKSLTIHKLDTDLSKAIEQLAFSSGLSQNKVIKRLLRKALGLNETPEAKPDFSEFCGIWTKEEALQFEEGIKEFEKVDESLWL